MIETLATIYITGAILKLIDITMLLKGKPLYNKVRRLNKLNKLKESDGSGYSIAAPIAVVISVITWPITWPISIIVNISSDKSDGQ